ncbi:ferric reductase family protein [Aspergillus saccharolyticus JOP 1030-1]|uniref:FRE family ferric-chelate reductase n=1 Tax=Aspergillus saccharolyticus JOP 1030-1 TaxID=1450539 RepID=A0A318Z4Q1_9EURO|nr:FRE family ferric-chelate reductase [Aspergillus saccharolyticus JOP 1030-1]PYH42285.1 FRE family ferric-chelate reductase [Aspergillus saccharolyticus JOP 1030-1]
MLALCGLIFFIVFYTSPVASSALPKNERCVTAIYTAYGYLSFAAAPDVGFWETRCQNPLKVTSIYAASDVYCLPFERKAGILQLQQSCRDFGHLELIPREQLAENLTRDALRRMTIVKYLEVPREHPINTPVLLAPSYYDTVFQTIDTWEFEVWSHYAYGLLGYAFWLCILALGILQRLGHHITQSQMVQTSYRTSPGLRTLCLPVQKLCHWVQVYLVVPHPLRSNGRKVLWWTFPTRLEAIVVLAFWILSIIVCTASYRLIPNNIYWPDGQSQLLRYAADRTGILSFANIPLLWLFAGRNNIFIWATGWSFATFNLFHRHVAWIATIQAVAHTSLYLFIMYGKGRLLKKLQKPYLLWGTGATILMVLVLPLAIQWFRHRSYEIFLLIHIIFSVGLLVGCFYHTIIFSDHEYWTYLWPAVAIWSADRALRVIRLIYCNVHVRCNAGNSIQYTKSFASYDESADVIRLEVFPGSKLLCPNPGQYYYLYQPFRLTGWESHPFTLGHWFYESDYKDASPTPPLTKEDHALDVTQVPLLSDSASSESTEEIQLKRHAPRGLKLVFWIRPYDGWTRQLRDQCRCSPTQSTDSTILLEGPYGERFPLWNYESVLLVAGGTGIAAIIPYIHEHLLRTAEDPEQAASQIRDLQLVWVARQAAFIRQIAARELAPALIRDDFRASFYATGTQTSTASNSVPCMDELEIVAGRPNVESVVLAHAHAAQLSESSVAVLVCGPVALADQTRAAVQLALERGYRSIRYVEESFSW